MNQATKVNIEDQAFEDALEYLKQAVLMAKNAKSVLTAATDNVIIPALSSSLLHKNCEGFNKITAILRNLSDSKADKICLSIETYFTKYLKIPANTIIYIPGLHKFSCNMTPVLQWHKINPNYKDLIDKMPLSKWLTQEKKNKAPVKTGQDMIKKAMEAALKQIETYREENSVTWQDVYKMIKSKLEN